MYFYLFSFLESCPKSLVEGIPKLLEGTTKSTLIIFLKQFFSKDIYV